MPKLIKALVFLFAAAALAYAGGRGYSSLTDGFSVGNITYDKPYDPRWETVQNFSGLAGALSQPYTYLGKGHQSFVFESADGKFVVKFLKCHLVEIKPWLAWLPLPRSLENLREKRVTAKQKRLDGIFSGWKIAYEMLPHETGVLAVHMNNTSGLFSQPLAVKNKAGWTYEIDLDKSAFLVQRKVDMLLPTLESYMSLGQQAQAEQVLGGMLGMYAKFCGMGISDADPQIMRNTGVSEGTPILIDVGRLKHDPQVLQHEACIQEVITKTRLFVQWLQKNYPPLASAFDQQLAELRSSHVSLSQ